MYIARVQAERGIRLMIERNDSFETNAPPDVPSTGAVLAVVATGVVAGLVAAIVAAALPGTAFAADDLALELAWGTRRASAYTTSGPTSTERG